MDGKAIVLFFAINQKTVNWKLLTATWANYLCKCQILSERLSPETALCNVEERSSRAPDKYSQSTEDPGCRRPRWFLRWRKSVLSDVALLLGRSFMWKRNMNLALVLRERDSAQHWFDSAVNFQPCVAAVQSETHLLSGKLLRGCHPALLGSSECCPSCQWSVWSWRHHGNRTVWGEAVCPSVKRLY